MKFTAKKAKPSKLTSLNFVKTDFFSDAKLPLVIFPNVSGVDLALWISQQKDYIDLQLQKYGAILFRGFNIRDEEDFHKIINHYNSDLLEYKERSTPRTSLGKNVYTATEYPADLEIPLHNENSYSQQFPLKLWFCCIKASETGGETPLADSRKIYRDLSEEIKDIFSAKRVKYTRNYNDAIDLDWRTVFQTDSINEVEKYCSKADIQCFWDSSQKLKTEQIRSSSLVHPHTKEKVWFNQAHLFHYSSLPKDIRKDLLESTDESALTRNAYFGDGSEIPDKYLAEIRETYDKNKVSFKWQESDLLLVDNLLTAHGRNSYTGKRRIIVAMTEKYS